MKILRFAVLCFFPIVLGLLAAEGCKKEPPVVPEPTLSVTAVDASCIEAWLRVTTAETPATVRLLRDGQPVFVSRLLSPDTLLIDEGLLPKQTYTYQLQRLNDNSTVIETSASVQVITLDTTSHQFQWSIDTLGTHASVLYDVAIINDTLVYAVGEIFHRDSSQNWTFFNLAKWNGREWTLQRVFYRENNIIHTTWILAFAWNDIWITPYTRWDGTAWREVPFDPIFSGVRTNKAWGTSSRDFFVVGDGGFIAHYNGTTWRRVESGTGLPIMDIYGARKVQGGEYEIMCVAEAYGVPGGSKLFLLENVSISEVATTGLQSWGVQGIWFLPQRQYIAVGQGVWRSYSARGTWWLDDTLPRIATASISGQTLNDIVVCGSFWLLAHSNGATWQTYFPRTSGALGAVEIMGDRVFAVGHIETRAVAIIGRR